MSAFNDFRPVYYPPGQGFGIAGGQGGGNITIDVNVSPNPHSTGLNYTNGVPLGSGQTIDGVIEPRAPEGVGVSSDEASRGSDRLTLKPGTPICGADVAAAMDDDDDPMIGTPGKQGEQKDLPAWSFDGIAIGPSSYGAQFHFVKALHDTDFLVKLCHGLAKDRGWWTDIETGADMTVDPKAPGRRIRNKGELLMLVTSELGEAMEAARKQTMDDHLPHHDGLTVELADAVIRIFDMAGGLNLNLGAALAEKLAYNARRADHSIEVRRADGGKKV